jgi:hypothetical protein
MACARRCTDMCIEEPFDSRQRALGHAAERLIYAREPRVVVYRNQDGTDDYTVVAGDVAGPAGYKRYAEIYAGSTSAEVVLLFSERWEALRRPVGIPEHLTQYEDLLLALDSTLADMETAKRKGYLARDLPLLRAAADDIRHRRR